MSMREKLSHYKEEFDIKFADYFNDLSNELSLPEKSVYPQICIDLIRELSLVGGKRQRVAYLYETFRLFNSEVKLNDLNLIACAISIELLQTHLLIHDDIIDNSPARRGIPTTLFSLKEMLDTEDKAPLGMAILADYKAVRSSTFAPMMLGLILASQDSKENIDRITRYSTNVGIAGQIQDDYLGLFGDETITEKSNSSDVKEGKHTLLIVNTLAQCTDEEKEFINAVLGNDNVVEADIEKVKEIVKRYKVDVLVKNIAKKYAQLAADEAQTWEDWNQEAVEFFVEASEWFVNRNI